MIIDCISDLHGYYPTLEGGDLLIVAGDLTSADTKKELYKFDDWLCHQPYKKKIFVAGNHDNSLIDEKPRKYMQGNNNGWFEKFEYLCDTGTEFEGLKIWGSPWSAINPKCKAFTGSEEKIAKRFDLIPENTDILITHSPPYGILDTIEDGWHVGCVHLRNLIVSSDRLPKLKLHVFGHVHEDGGKTFETTLCKFVNASYVNEEYEPVNAPVRITL